MCYMVYLSTDCADDLSGLTTDLVRFEKPSPENQSPCPWILKHENQWFVGSKSGCSCAFRHVCRESLDLGFREPEDWFPEESDDIDATRLLYAILNELVQRELQVEVLDCWSGDENAEATSLDLSLTEVAGDRFRLYQGHIFTLKP